MARSIDQLAREARRETQKPSRDLLKEGFPFTPGLWMIVIEPIKPRALSEGGVILAEVSQTADEFQVTVGRVLKAGPSCMAGQTTSGIPLGVFTDDIKSPKDLIGKYVVYQQHVGQTLELRRTGEKLKVMKVTDLLGTTEDPQAWKFYV